MKNHLRIECDDSLDHFDQKKIQTSKNYTSGIPSSNHNNFNFSELSYSQTPKSRTNSKSPFSFKSPKYRGIIGRTVLERLEYYEKQNQNIKASNGMTSKMIQQEKSYLELKQKPQINQISKILYHKVRKEKKLSPNILKRFQTYECERNQKQAQYDLMRTCNYLYKNDKSKCKSILQDKDFNRSKSKSTKDPYSTRCKNPDTIGKLVKTTTLKHKSPSKDFYYSKQQPGRLNPNQAYFHTLNKTQKNKENELKMMKTQQIKNTKYCTQNNQRRDNSKIKNNLQEIFEKCQYETSSPFVKKRQNVSKWHVVI